MGVRPKDIHPGLWLRIPLAMSGRAVGLVARTNPVERGNAIGLGYFFVPSLAASVAECREQHRADTASLVTVFHSNAAEMKRWAIIGKDEEFDSAQWPLPLKYSLSDRSAVRPLESDLLEFELIDMPGAQLGDYPGSASAQSGSNVETGLANIDRARWSR